MEQKQIWRYGLETLSFHETYTCLFVTASWILCFQGLKDKKLKGQLAVREELYGKSAQAAAKAEKVICFP